MSNADSPEAKELRLVGNVELRLAMITADGAMEKALNTYLAPLLLKLASEFVSVRNKVISVCQHINTRIKPPYVRLYSRFVSAYGRCWERTVLKSFGFFEK